MRSKEIIKNRCPWATDELYNQYHDTEWGVPSRDDRHLFEMIILEGAQAGLSWSTILRKRENYRKAFEGFDATKVARFNDRKVAELLANEGIVRNRLKIASAIGNAKAFLSPFRMSLVLSANLSGNSQAGTRFRTHGAP